MSDLDDLMEQVDQPRIRELEQLIFKARDDYYNGRASVSDEVYDAWLDELKDLKPGSSAVKAVGAPPSPVSEWKKVRHGISMGSLDKVNTPEELANWVATSNAKGEPLLVTEKLDGISIHVRYEKGSYVQAITRGDGETGEDITVNVQRMRGIPARLPKKESLSLRGEIILTKDAHAKHFSEYANPRNAASGIAKRYDGTGCEHLTVLFYQVVEGKDFVSEGEQFQWLAGAGFGTPNWYVTMPAGTVSPQDLWFEYQQTKRAELGYEIDGLVIRLDNLAKQLALGEKDGRPRGAIAFKFASMKRESVVRAIVNETGGMGVITPVAELDPIQLAGVQVTRASLYNWKYVRALGLDVGATVLVARANDVIPRVESLVKGPGSVAQPPDVCPSCGTKAEFQGEFLVCPNTADCPAQTVGRIKRWVKSLDIKEWGDVLIEKLVGLGLVRTVPDLYRLTEEQLAGIDRMGEKSAQNVLGTLRAKDSLPLEDILGSLSIPLCATTTVKLVVDAGWDTWEKMQQASIADFGKVAGLGPVKARALVDWIRGTGRTLIPDLLTVGVKVQARIRGSLTGQSFCFTGASTKPRAELEALVKAAGGEVKGSVTKKLSYLVMADPNSNSSKAQAARKNGTQCISEEEFLSMVGAA